MTSELNWFKSSYSGNDGPDCVEVAISTPHATVHVRDSKTRNSARLTVRGEAWAEFLTFASER
ncbi:DUF397 domain-containing protein [Streptomyces sp. NPDC059063]|uniref:DUF397 domain-containing protein n=1 Tax=unclassified Streptomyces TaxID=2593676 RepID=UPI0036994F51